MKLRVAIVSVVPSPYQRDLFEALAQRPEVDLRVFYQEAASPDSPWPEKPLASYERILPGRWFSLRGARVHFNWGLPDFRTFDVIVCNTLLPSITGQWLMRRAVRGRRWIFLGERRSPRNFVRDLLAAPLHRATAIVAIGKIAEREYHAQFPEPAHFNIPYHCVLTPFSDRPPASNHEPVFLFCGQMILRKGVDVLLAAFAQLQRGRLLLVGREADLPEMLAAMPPAARARCSYAGFQAPDDLPRYFAQADVFVLPSRHDGWGVVVNQALGAGLPIICSDAVGAAFDLVEADVNGTVVPAGDVEALAQAMKPLADDPALRARWGAASRQKAQAWTPEAGAAKWVAALQEVCSA